MPREICILEQISTSSYMEACTQYHSFSQFKLVRCNICCLNYLNSCTSFSLPTITHTHWHVCFNTNSFKFSIFKRTFVICICWITFIRTLIQMEIYAPNYRSKINDKTLRNWCRNVSEFCWKSLSPKKVRSMDTFIIFENFNKY